MSNSATPSSPGKVRMRALRGGLPTTIISAALVVSGVLVATNGSGAATPSAGAAKDCPITVSSTPISQSCGRFLLGKLDTTSLDTLAAVKGAGAANDSSTPTVVNQAGLDATALQGAVSVPLGKALNLPALPNGLPFVTFGAVGQYAKAVNDGSALGASGAVDDQGGISIGGSSAAPADATIDLAGLGGGAVAQTLANLKLTIGALSAQAGQAAGVNGVQSGTYQIAGLKVELTAPLLQQVMSQVNSGFTSAITQITAAAPACGPTPNPLTPVCFTGVSALNNVLTNLTTLYVSCPAGTTTCDAAHSPAITIDLSSGKITIDLKQLLLNQNIDLNNLPHDTDLVQYIFTALGSGAITDALISTVDQTVAQLNTAVGALGVSVAGAPAVALSTLTGPLGAISAQILAPLKSGLDSGLAPLGTNVLQPLATQLQNVLALVANHQATSNGEFQETALRVAVGTGATAPGSVPTGIPTALPSLTGLPAPLSVNAVELGAPVAALPLNVTPLRFALAMPAAVVAPMAPLDTSSAPVAIDLANALVGPSSVVAAASSSPTTVPTPAVTSPGPTSTIRIPGGGGMTSVALTPVKHVTHDNAPMGIALIVVGLMGLAWSSRRQVATLVARVR